MLKGQAAGCYKWTAASQAPWILLVVFYCHDMLLEWGCGPGHKVSQVVWNMGT